MKKKDLEYRIEISLEDAIKGKEIKISVPRRVTCKSCNGTGAKNGTALKTCNHCNGQGQVRVSQGFFSVQQTCPVCKGKGQVIEENCPDCSGSGFIQETKKLAVKIPAGVEDGMQLRVSGKGNEPVTDGIPGDLLILISEIEDNDFKREGNNLHLDLYISISDAVLGVSKEINTVNGKVRIKLDAGIQSGKILRLRGKGLKSVNGYGSGDLLVHVNVWTPKTLSKDQKNFFEDNKNNDHFKPSPDKNDKSFFEKVKDMFS